MGIAVLGGGWLLVSTYVHGRSGYYASEMGGMFVSIAFGIVLIFIASACHKAAKLLDNPASHEELHQSTPQPKPTLLALLITQLLPRTQNQLSVRE